MVIYGTEIFVSGSNLQDEDFNVYICFENTESENHIFNVWFLFMYMCVNVCLLSAFKKKTETLKLIFYILILYGCYLKLFKKTEKKPTYRGIQKNSNTLRPIDGIPYKLDLMYLNCTKYNIINIDFSYIKKHVTNRLQYEYYA